MKKRTLRPDELQVWAKIAATVTPRPGRAAPSVEPSPSPPVKRPLSATPAKTKSAPPGLARLALEGGGSRVGAGPRGPEDVSGEKRVRRGRLEIDGRLDLHGLTQDEARAALSGFLERLSASGGRCGLVITGKGRSGGEGVLRRRLPEWLGEPGLARLVSGYAPAHARHGGDGAWYLFIRTRR